MARYDQDPGFEARLPAGPFNPHDSGMSAPGGSGGTRADGSHVGDVTVRDTYDSTQTPGQTVSVGTGDTDEVSGYDQANLLFPSSDGYASSGPAGGHAIVDSSHRYPWQQQPGREV